MLLATGLFLEFAQFLRILSWILLPVLGLAVIITMLLHYRRKKMLSQNEEGSEDSFLLQSPAEIMYNRPGGVHILFDHTGLIRQYKDKLSYNYARYAALKQDFEDLETKYTAAIGTGTPPAQELKKNNMEQSVEQMQVAIDMMADDHATEKQSLLSRLEQLERSYKTLEDENDSLQQQLNVRSITDGEREVTIKRWKEENALLKSRLSDHEYLGQIQEVKKHEIGSLQDQLVQQIKNIRQVERQRETLKSELEQLKQVHDGKLRELNTSRTELIQKREAMEMLQTELEVRDLRLQEKQQLITSQQGQVISMGNILQEMKRQNEMLNAAVADSQDLVNSLREQVSNKESRINYVEEKLENNRQMLKKLQRVMSECIGEETEPTQVIEMKPAYVAFEESIS